MAERRYYPYGETRLSTGTIYTDKLFTGQREMTGLGIYHYQARFYSLKLGRFLSADSIVPNAYNPQDLNRFSYVRNNPLLYTDPTGHMLSVGEGGGGGCYPFCTTPPPPPPCSSSICNPNGGGGGGGGGGSGGGGDGGGGGSGGGNGCSGPNPSVVCLPTLTPTLTPTPTITPVPGSYCNSTIQDCLVLTPTPYPTPTPFGANYGPAIEDNIGIFNPFLPSFEPDVATWFWNTLLEASPVLGLPASSLNQVIAGAVNTTVNAAVNVSNAIGNATNNLAWAIGDWLGTGIGPTLPIFILPSNFQSPSSPPTGSN